jgi:hypothetical protein
MSELTVLEPISTGDVIDRAVRLYRRNFVPLISVVAAPALIYYASAMMVSFGYAQMLQSAQAGFNPGALFLVLFGLAGYVVYLFSILSAVSGMSRAIGDHIMLGDSITFRGCWRFARRRLGDIALTGLISIPVLSLFGVVLVIAFFVLFMGLAFLVGLGSALGLPPWLGALVSFLVMLASAFLFVAIGLLMAARIIFVPDALMIEGRSSTAAFGRAMQLGGGRTWYRLGMIVLFTYFINLAVLTALMEPLGIAFWMNGWPIADLLLQPGWNAVYAAVNQVSSLLVWPIWITSFTLLYFDTRVRKEGYDIELMTVGLPQPAHSYLGAAPQFRPVLSQSSSEPGALPAREYMQTGPLGLGGYPTNRPVTVNPPVAGNPPPNGNPAFTGNPPVAGSPPPSMNLPLGLNPAPSANPPAGLNPPPATMLSTVEKPPLRCAVCGMVAMEGARYCIACGDLLQIDESTPVA